MSDLFVFRTGSQEVLDAFRTARVAYEDWSRAVRSFAKSVHPDARPMMGSVWGAHRFDGISLVDPVPEGWRVKKQSHGESYLVPNRGTKVGKAVAESLEELRVAPDVRASLLGMPSVVVTGNAFLHPGVDDDLEKGALYVIWGVEPVARTTGFSKVKEVDSALWEPVKLARYYALKEAVA